MLIFIGKLCQRIVIVLFVCYVMEMSHHHHGHEHHHAAHHHEGHHHNHHGANSEHAHVAAAPAPATHAAVATPAAAVAVAVAAPVVEEYSAEAVARADSFATGNPVCTLLTHRFPLLTKH
jgi:hypothetical protein